MLEILDVHEAHGTTRGSLDTQLFTKTIINFTCAQTVFSILRTFSGFSKGTIYIITYFWTKTLPDRGVDWTNYYEMTTNGNVL